MKADQIAKNILLDHVCENCKLGYGKELQHRCKKVIYEKIEEENEEGYITVAQLYPEETTCENWEECEDILKFELNITTTAINSKPIKLIKNKKNVHI